MGGFFKTFFAALLALVVFTVIIVLILLRLVGGPSLSQKTGYRSKSGIGHRSRPILSVSRPRTTRLSDLGSDDQYDVPGLYDLVRLVRHAEEDTAIKGIYLKCNDNPNGFATNEEIRNALLDFKKSGKFVYAYGEVIPQKAYYVANVADRIYCNPKGGVEWKGFAVEMTFLKGPCRNWRSSRRSSMPVNSRALPNRCGKIR